MHLGRTGFADHLDDLFRRRSANDRIVDEHDPPAVDQVLDRIELQTNAKRADRLRRLDKRAADIMVANDRLAEIEFPTRSNNRSPRQRPNPAPARRVGIDRMFDRQLFAHLVPRFVDRNAENGRVRTRKIDVLERADGMRLFLKRTSTNRGRFSSMISISPGSTSRTYSASIRSNAHVSDATHHASSSLPRTSGLKPRGSRTATSALGVRNSSRKRAFGLFQNFLDRARQRPSPVSGRCREGWFRCPMSKKRSPRRVPARADVPRQTADCRCGRSRCRHAGR